MKTSYPFSVRLPEDLMVEITRVATQENRSLGKVAVMAISEGFRARGVNGGEWSTITNIEAEGKTMLPRKKIADISVGAVAQNIPARGKVDMQALRDICNMESVPMDTDSIRGPFVEVDGDQDCPHRELCEDGEWYGCSRELGHKGKCQRGGRVEI